MRKDVFRRTLSADRQSAADSLYKIVLHVGEHLLNIGNKRATRFGKGDKMMIALQDLKSYFVFILANLATIGRLRDVQPLGGLAEMQVACHSKHVLELPKRRNHVHKTAFERQ
jgi:hypothetical protein